MADLRIGVLCISLLTTAFAVGMNPAQTTARLTGIEDQQRSFRGELEEVQHALEQLRQEIDKLKADVDLRFTELQSALGKGARNSSDENATSEELDTSHPLEKARTLFNERRYEEAQHILESYSSTKLTKSDLAVAQYWLGEVFFAQRRYQEAALAFVTGYKADAHGRRTPETLLKLARSLIAVKKTKEARTTLQKLLQDYPNAAVEIREKARELLKKTT
ncbi:MAG: tetratricopeptide repeat protein [Holosporales bacterium]|jgi:tol-pal system protein YbgF|nr:tetratricopeptide repeat protein [Holosporales bacterium]